MTTSRLLQVHNLHHHRLHPLCCKPKETLLTLALSVCFLQVNEPGLWIRVTQGESSFRKPPQAQHAPWNLRRLANLLEPQFPHQQDEMFPLGVLLQDFNKAVLPATGPLYIPFPLSEAPFPSAHHNPSSSIWLTPTILPV